MYCRADPGYTPGQVNSGSLTAPVFFQTAKAHCFNNVARSLVVDCALQTSPHHVLGLLAAHLYALPRTPLTPLRFLQCSGSARETVLVLVGCETLLREDAMVLWAILHMKEVVQTDVPLRVLLVTERPWNEFVAVFGGITPIIVREKRTKQNLVSSAATINCPEDMDEKVYHGLVQNVYSIAKDQISTSELLAAYVSRMLPVFREVSDLPLNSHARLYQAALKPVTSLVNGESLRTLYTAHLSTLTQTEKFLLLAAYISANNPAKYDVKIFGSAGKKARVRKTQKMERVRYPLPKLFPLDRLLAIFYFISAQPVPMSTAQAAVTRLVEIQLLHRVTGLVKLDAPKYRCAISLDVATMVSRDLTFDLQKYLLVEKSLYSCESMDVFWLLGFSVGVVVATALLGVSVYKRILVPILARRLPLVERILKLDRERKWSSPPETANWLNFLTLWLFETIHDTPAFALSLSQSLSESLVDLRRKPMGCILKEAVVEDCAAGTLPILSDIRVVATGRDDTPLTVAARVHWTEGVSAIARMESIFGQVWFLGAITRLTGTMYVVVHNKQYHVGFKRLDVAMEGRVMLGNQEWRWLNWLVAKVWMPWRLRQKYRMPNMQSRWMIDRPPCPPYPWDPAVQKDNELLYREVDDKSM
ncbi:hypothetical protein PSACC_00768 [Paramicrosporidium saccamoebae]|uniref:Origin recognition complex subunit 5 C-terminal domain-containing protein n=1 Tax=Paramicrosporidium saccamoebae TaxID=1246581 RepID=A0A2H9TNQ8_9FUNG|nr:hypothetical protein PSACC_00768 [Paramicrosporidium saccamoebae]